MSPFVYKELTIGTLKKEKWSPKCISSMAFKWFSEMYQSRNRLINGIPITWTDLLTSSLDQLRLTLHVPYLHGARHLSYGLKITIE